MLTLHNNSLVVDFPYNPMMVNAIKSLPSSERRYDPATRTWLVSPKHGAQVAEWIEKFLGKTVSIPQVLAPQTLELKAFTVVYLGACKDRGNGERSAYGNNGTDWMYIFTELVLRQWFEGIVQDAPLSHNTLYSVLGIKRDIEQEEIKTAYRRLVKQWHPDICKEQNAAETFMRIQDAYTLLSNPQKRARYDAGLLLEASLGRIETDFLDPVYRAPLRCGHVLANGYESIGRFVITQILGWEDIIEGGKTLVVSWPAGQERWIEQWI